MSDTHVTYSELRTVINASELTVEVREARSAYWAGFPVGKFQEDGDFYGLTDELYRETADNAMESFSGNPYFLYGIKCGVEFVKTDPRRGN